MSFYPEPKDQRKSIRLKYNRRREFLRHCIEQFILISEERLDEEKYGEIYKKEEAELLLGHAKKLLDIFPSKKELELTQEDFDNFDLMIEEAKKETEILFQELQNDSTDFNKILNQINASKTNDTTE